MKIDRVKFVCPNCKEVYYNRELASYSSKFGEATKSFQTNNKVITECQKCGTKLVRELNS